MLVRAERGWGEGRKVGEGEEREGGWRRGDALAFGGRKKRREKGRVCWKRGLELWKVFFFFCFFLGEGNFGVVDGGEGW